MPPDEINPYAPPSSASPPSTATRQSRLGIAALVCGVLALVALGGFLFCSFLFASDVLERNDPPRARLALMIGLWIASLALAALGVLLGIASLFMRDHRRSAGVVGLVVSGGYLAIVAVMVAASLMRLAS